MAGSHPRRPRENVQHLEVRAIRPDANHRALRGRCPGRSVEEAVGAERQAGGRIAGRHPVERVDYRRRLRERGRHAEHTEYAQDREKGQDAASR
jgi:hypothetical protein